MKIHCLRFFSLTILTLPFFLNPSILLAESYTDAMANALKNIQNVYKTNEFVPDYPARGNKKMVTITGDPLTEKVDFGLTYQNYSGTNYLVTRTLTNVSYYNNSSGSLRYGVGDYTTYDDAGHPNTQASWVTTGNDATNFIDNNVTSAANVGTAMEQGLGMDTKGTHTAIVEYGVLPNVNNLIRPTKLLSINSYSTNNTDYTWNSTFDPTKPSEMRIDVFNRVEPYLQYWQTSTSGTFPWSQLGYTYYWGQSTTDLDAIQGLSEFIILGGTAVKIIGIYSPQSYYYTKNKNGAFSTDSGAEYGNGFASFNVSGNCDTIWAGNAFQVNASTDTSNPNKIIIASGSTISQGQGILVWSPNYTVTNSGTISGSTDNKLKDDKARYPNPGMSGTADVALLFLGDTTYGAVAGGKNILNNSGTISSPGVAIEADAGDTTITNSNNGIISGGTYAILTAAGDDRVYINGGSITGSINLGTGTDLLDLSGSDSNVTLNFSLNRDTRTSAQVVNAETVSFTDNKVTLAVNQASGSANIRNNDSFLIVDAGTTLTADPAAISITNDATLPMVTFAASKSGNQLSLLASRDNSYYTDNSSNFSLGSVLDDLANTGTSDMADIIGALDDSGNAVNVAQLQPAASMPIINAAVQALNNFGNVFSLQMARLMDNADSNLEVYAVNDGKRKRLAASAIDNMLVYNSDSILENSFDRPQKWEAFATGFGVMGFQSDKGSTSGYRSAGGGTQFGFYRRVNNDFMLGMLGGYMFDNVRLNNKTSSQDVNSVRIGPCAKWLRNNLYATGALTYGYHAVQGERKINIGVINRQADSDYSMNDVSPYLETGYIFHLNKNFEIVPNISLQYDWMRSSSYNESGAGAADLSVKAFDSNSLVSVLGVRFNGRMEMKSMVFLPEFNVGWQHEYLGRADDVQAFFSSESAGAFTTNPNMFDRSAVKAGVAANFIYGKNHNALGLQYNAEVYDSASNHVFSITLRNYF